MNENRGQTGEMSNIQRLQNLQNEIRSQVKNSTQNYPIKQSNVYQEGFEQFTLGRKSPIDQQIKSPSSISQLQKTPNNFEQRSISQGKFKTARFTQQNYSPQSPNIESAKDNLQILQQKLQSLRQEKEQPAYDQGKTQEDIYEKMRAAIPKSSSIYSKNKNQAQQIQNTQKLAIREEYQDYRPQSQAITQVEKSVQDRKEFENRLQKMANKKSFDFKSPEVPSSKIQLENTDPFGDKSTDFRSNYNFNQKQSQGKPQLQQLFSADKIREVQSALVQCSDGIFGQLSPSQAFIQLY